MGARGGGEDLWFARGILFECTQCGKCCRGEPGYVWVTRDEIGPMADALKMSREEFAKRYLRREGLRVSLQERSGGDCVLWHGRCTVYAARPKQCRTFPFWKEAIVSKRDFDAMRRGCPGVGHGRRYSCEEILAIAQGLRETSAKDDEGRKG
jgi:hypothetical protein